MTRECTPTREDTRVLAKEHALIPVYREVLADMLTPVRAYSLLCPPGTPGFLLESVEGGERLARYSFIGFEPKDLDLSPNDPLAALRAVAAEVCRDSMAEQSVISATRPPATSSGCPSPPALRRPCPRAPSCEPTTSLCSTT